MWMWYHSMFMYNRGLSVIFIGCTVLCMYVVCVIIIVIHYIPVVNVVLNSLSKFNLIKT